MNTINVLIVVDVEGALSSTNNDLQGNVYLIDTNKHDGSGSEGTAELYTACNSTTQGGDTIIWSVAPVDPSTEVSIHSFTGQMVEAPYYLVPAENNLNGSWQGGLQSNLPAQNIQYSVVLQFDGGRTMSFDPFLKVNQ